MTCNTELVVKEEVAVYLMPEGACIQEIVNAVNAIGVFPRDLIAIFQVLEEAGPFSAKLTIMCGIGERMDHLSPMLNNVEQPVGPDIAVAQRGDVAGVMKADTELQALRKACKDLESILVKTLLKRMRKSPLKSEGAGSTCEIYKSIGDLELARLIVYVWAWVLAIFCLKSSRRRYTDSGS